MASASAFSADILEIDLPASDSSRQRLREWIPRLDHSYQVTDVAFVDEHKDWLVKAYKVLARLAHVEANWNSYGAPPPAQAALDSTRGILRSLAVMDSEPTSIDASSEGGVCLSFQRGDRYADIECLNSGEILAVTSRGGRNTQVWRVTTVGQQIETAINTIRAFVES